MENRDFIVFGLHPWDIDIGSTLKYTAMEFSKKNRVLFVNPPLHRSEILKNRKSPKVQKRLNILKGKESDLVQITPSFWVLYPRTIIESVNWIRSNALFDFFNKINESRFARKIEQAIKHLNFKDYIIFDDNSMIIGYYLKELLKPKLFIYLIRDAVLEVKYHKRHGPVLEHKLIQKSDLIVTNSDYFCNYAKQFNEHAYLIGQGCDLTIYNDNDGTLPIPDDIRKISSPIVGYTGSLSTIRLDINLLLHIARTRPDWNLVLIGPEDATFINSELHNLPNVIFLGRKDPNQLPGYIKAFDVAINPQLLNKITDVNYPLKIDEYLAMGKPTVATRTAFMNYFKDNTYLPLTKEEYVRDIELAMNENTPELEARRKECASGHSWENFVLKIYSHALLIEKEKKQNQFN